jgi:hypothetical protein
MTLLHILPDGPDELASRIIAVQALEREVRVIDLSEGAASYDELVDAIFSADWVTSWTR